MENSNKYRDFFHRYFLENRIKLLYNHLGQGAVAQLGERYPRTVEDVGSNPIGSTKEEG